jgi:hypothetical protein
MNKQSITSISPVVVAAAALIRLGWVVLFQCFAGFNLDNLWHHWLRQLVIGG